MDDILDSDIMRVLQRIRPPFATTLLRLSLGSAVILGGCAVGPAYREPPPIAPTTWQAPLPHGSTAAGVAEWWRQQFDDAVLERLVARTEADSPTLAKAWANIEKARATLTAAGAAGLPNATGQASIARARQQAGVTTVDTPTTRSAGIDAAWELDLFGKIRRGTEAAQARIDARVNDWHDARISLAAEVADIYVQYRGCELLSDAYARELASTRETARATADLVVAGFSAPADGALARAAVASTSSTLFAQRAQCRLLIKSLVSLTGFDESALLTLLAEGGRHLPLPAALEVQSVPAQVLRQRPDLASRERELAAASAEIGAAVADLYPSLSLSGTITVSAAGAMTGMTTWAFGPSVSIPLFDGARRHAAVDRAHAAYASAYADYRQGVRNVVKEVEQALVSLESTARRSEEAERAAQEYRRYFEATEQNWHAGGVSLLSLEEARRSALTAEIELIALQRDRVKYWIALYKALGGGWQPGAPVPPSEAAAVADPQHSKEGGSP